MQYPSGLLASCGTSLMSAVNTGITASGNSLMSAVNTGIAASGNSSLFVAVGYAAAGCIAHSNKQNLRSAGGAEESRWVGEQRSRALPF